MLNDGLSAANAFKEFFTSFEAPNAYKKSECSSFNFDRFKSLKNKFFKNLISQSFKNLNLNKYQLNKLRRNRRVEQRIFLLVLLNTHLKYLVNQSVILLIFV